MTSRRNRQGGLTLIELMVAIAILAILATVAAPSFTRYFAAQRVKGAAEEIYADLQFARMESVQRNAPVQVTFASGGYTIVSNGVTLKQASLHQGSTISFGSSMVVTFDPVRATAVVTGGPGATVSAEGTDGTLRISISPSGRANLCSPEGTFKGYPRCT